MPKYSTMRPGEAADNLEEMQFQELGQFNSAHLGVFWSEAGGPSPWEMHPDEDELLHIIEGKVEIEILPKVRTEVPDKVVIASGSYLVIPKGLWHRHHMLARSKEMYLSPSKTLHSNEEDPR